VIPDDHHLTARYPEARLLVIDDEPANVELLEQTLRNAGYEHVLSTTDPSTGLAIAREWAPDLVLLDLLMPSLSGHEVLTNLRGIDAAIDIPVLVLTADARPETRRRALVEGATDFLTKPLDLLEVLLRVGSLLHTNALHSELRQRTVDLEAELERRLADHLGEREHLLAKLSDAHEAERSRIAREVHDETIQAMIAVAMQLETMAVSAPEHREQLDELVRGAREAIRRLRMLIIDLGSAGLDDGGLEAGLRELARRAFGAAATVEVGEAAQPPPHIAVQLYRIAQAAISNARQHSDCQHVHLSLRRVGDDVELTLTDDGIGFDPDAVAEQSRPDHIGMAVMHERVALLGGGAHVSSAPGEGTTVRIRIPMPATPLLTTSVSPTIHQHDDPGSST
jgi:signal transduction histidine kinase